MSFVTGRKKAKKKKKTKTTIVINFQKWYYIKTWGPLKEIYLKFTHVIIRKGTKTELRYGEMEY